MYKINRSTICQLGSAFVFAIIVAFPYETNRSIIGWLIYKIGFFVDILFHEMGHTVFYWLYGIPAIPGIMTIIGADQAGGMTMQLADRTWFLQITAIVILTWFCNNLRKASSYYLYPFAVLLAFILITCATGYHREIISYMGHGGAILAAGILLFKAFSNTNMRSGIERWLNGFFGFFLVLNNLFFSYGLIYDPEARLDYISHQAFGTSDMDFVKIASGIPHLTLNHVAWFTIFLCFFITAIACFLAYLVDKENKFLISSEQEIQLKTNKLKSQPEDLSNF